MDRTERFYKIERLLRSHRALPLTDLLKELGVSRATFKRDLEYLRDRFSAPIVWDSELRGYRLERGPDADKFSLPGFWLSPNEVQALFALEHLIESMGPSLLGQSLAPLKERLQKLLGDSKSSAKQIRQRVRLVHQRGRPVNVQHFAATANAVLNRQQLRLVHLVRDRKEITDRVVSPQRLTYYRGSWYLEAWCHLRKAIRSFALDAIQSLEVLESVALEVSKDELDRFMEGGYGIFAGEVQNTAKIRFSAQSAQWVSMEQWHPRQQGRYDPQGRYVLEIPYGDPRELLKDVLGHGPEAEILAPASLRKLAIAQLRESLNRYS